MTTQVFIDHGEAYRNLGDEAMLRAAIDKFERRLDDFQILVPAENPDLLPNQISDKVETVPSIRPLFSSFNGPYSAQCRLADVGLNELDYSRFIELFLTYCKKLPVCPAITGLTNAIQSSDIFYGTGGAYFNDYYPPGIGHKRWMYGQIPETTASVLSSQGFGPLENRWTRKATADALEHLDIVTFRDYEYSNSVVTELQPEIEKRIVGDEALKLETASSNRVDEYLQTAGIDPGQPFVAFHYRATDYTQDTGHLLDKLSDTIEELLEKCGLPVVFIPMSYGSHSGHDYEYGERLASKIDNDSFHLGPECRDAAVVKGAVGRARLATGLSYHFHVFALAQSVPPLVLYSGEYYRLKSEGLFGFYSLLDHVLDIETVETTDIADLGSNILSNEDIRQQIQKTNNELEDRTEWSVKRVIEIARDGNSL